MKTFFDFGINQEINPMKGIKDFFVNPLNSPSAKTLDLVGKTNKDMSLMGVFYNGMPTLLFPLKVLKLGQCTIDYTSMNKGTIYSQDFIIGFTITPDKYLMVDFACKLLKT